MIPNMRALNHPAHHSADISPQTAGQVKRMAEAWRAIDCYGMARIDFPGR